MRFHVVAMPHTQTNLRHNACAYTMKVLHFCQMMHSLGHEVYHYGAEGSEVDGFCVEHIPIISAIEQEFFFGKEDLNLSYKMVWDSNEPYWQLFNERATKEINKRKQYRDFVCVIAGRCHLPMAEQLGDSVKVVEFGIGYWNTFSKYRVFESYSHMHKQYGAEQGRDPDGYYYDCVIPNYFNPDDFPLKTKKSDYYLYLGRLINRKGVKTAIQTCEKIGAKLILAGQGCLKTEGQKVICENGVVFDSPNIEYVGRADVNLRRELYQNAIATFVPTIYVEPFGGVAVESQFAGTPAITTDWGAFTETVEHGKTGFRCRTLDHFIFAALNVHKLDPQYIHDRAVVNWSMDRVRWMYEEYFQMLNDLWDNGWNTEKKREQLDWLR
jgi:glycosyltransferase involved in cell wall biosynthesis